MNDLVIIEYGEPVTTSRLIAEGVGNQHKNVMELLKRHSKTEILSTYQTRKVPTKGRPMEVAVLNELQATFLITLMDNSPKVIEFKQALTKDFFSMREKLSAIAVNHTNAEWIENRQQGKLTRKYGTDTIKEFIDYAKSQGSTKPEMYYVTLSKMENKALWILEGKFKNIREVLDGQQLQIISNADMIAAKALKRGMEDNLHYKDIYKLAKNDVITFAELIGKSPVPAGISFIELKE